MDKNFDSIKHIDDDGSEFWYARELMNVLTYAKWENFHKVIKQAMISCRISQQEVSDHFPEVRKTVEMPSKPKKDEKLGFPEVGKTKKIIDYKLTRYACYLVVMNGDPRKETVAFGQTYFAIKTRQQELQELYDRLTEDERRLFLRGDIKQKNMLLAEVAHKAGITTAFEYADFTNAGYRGLYGGLDARDIANKKGLEQGTDILDYMGSAELGANLFRITQTEDIMKTNNVVGKENANTVHYKVGKAVRKTIEEIGGTMPEDQPTPTMSITEIEREQLKKLKAQKNKMLDE